jgi:hypothetical protein
MPYTPKTEGGLMRKIHSNTVEIMQVENMVYLYKKGRGDFTELEDIEDARALIESLREENRVLKEKLKEIKK